jgi:hypothetical protein
MPLPPTGRYIITVVDPEARWATSRQVAVIAAQSNTVDIDVGIDVGAGAADQNRSLP